MTSWNHASWAGSSSSKSSSPTVLNVTQAAELTAGHVPELRAAIEELAAAVRREPGCLTFVPYKDLGTDDRFYLYEIHQDLDAFKDHLQTAHVRKFFDALARHSTAAQSLIQLAELDVP